MIVDGIKVLFNGIIQRLLINSVESVLILWCLKLNDFNGSEVLIEN